MAKTEKYVDETEVEGEAFDQEDILNDNLDDLPEAQEITGAWLLKAINAKVKQGHGKRGPWSMINITLAPVFPVGEDSADRAAEYDLDDLPFVYHRVFYTTPRDKRDFVALTKAFGVVTGTLGERLAALKGTEVIARATPGKDNFGRPEVKLSAFRDAAAEYHGTVAE